MNITKIKISNYRLLKDFELDLQGDHSLSLVIGKNNCGKTSLLSILDEFIGSNSGKTKLSFNDFNLDFQKQLKAKIENISIDDLNNIENQSPLSSWSISLKLFLL